MPPSLSNDSTGSGPVARLRRRIGSSPRVIVGFYLLGLIAVVGLLALTAGVPGVPGTDSADKPSESSASEASSSPEVTDSPSSGRSKPGSARSSDEKDSPTPTSGADGPGGLPVELCGESYEIIDTQDLEDDGLYLGTAYLLENSSDDMCAVTVLPQKSREKVTMSVYIAAADDRRADDKGEYTHYAGPVNL
ncbi:MAG: hypothetical protein ACRD0P_14045, partial [Stackebrandtia sp.]